MCLQNMEETEKTSNKVDKGILNLFWDLTNKKPDKRIKICIWILRSLFKKQEQIELKKDLSVELKYSVERLVRGLASPRDAARLGYSLLLTEVLKQFPIIQIEEVLEHMQQHLAFTPNQEKRDVVFGKLFAYTSIIRSGRLANHSHLSFVVLGVYDLWQGRNYVLNACYKLFIDLFNQLSPDAFTQELWPHLKNKFKSGFDKCSPDVLWLFLLITRLFPEAASERYLKKHFNSANIFSADNFDHFKKLIRQTSSSLPKLHPLCSEITIMCANSKEAKEIWNALVNDNLFDGDQIEKSFVGFEMVKSVLETSTKKKKMLKFVLSKNSAKLRSLFARSYVNMKSPMNSASTQLAEYLCKLAIERDSSDIQMQILTFFLQPSGTVLFDNILRKKEVLSLIRNLLPESVKMYCEFLKAIALKKMSDVEDKEFVSETICSVAITQIGNLISHVKMSTDIDWRISIVKFLFLHAFFSIKKPTSDILHCEEEVEELSAKVKESCVNAFFKTLTSLYQRTDQQTPLEHLLQYLYMLLEYADELMASYENINPHFDLEKVQESWLQMKKMVHKLKKQSKKDSKINESNAFLALFMELGFHLFHDYEHISDVLEELHICCKKALGDRKHSMEQSEDNEREPHWIGVIIDIMLSLLSRPSQHLRRVVTFVFQILCPSITKDALQSILRVINPIEEEDDPMLVDESEIEELNFESGSSSDESDCNEPEVSKADELFREKMKKALGAAAADDSDAESAVLTDSEMFQLDDAISKVFKDKVQTGHTQMKPEDKTMLEFRLKCLDLIITYLKSDPPMYLVLHCIEPIIAAYTFSNQNEHQKHFLDKIVSTINIMTKIKKFQHVDNIEKSELKQLLKMLVAKCHKEVNIEVANKLYSLCVFVVLCFRRFESQNPDKVSSKSPSYVKRYLSAFDDFAMGKSHIYPQFFVSIMETCPDLAWNMITVCKNYAFDKNIRPYRRTQCLGLLYEAIKFSKRQETVDDQRVELYKTLAPITVKNLKESLQEDTIKPTYLSDLLNVMYLCHTSFTEKTNQSLFANYTDLVSCLNNMPSKLRQRLSKKGKLSWTKIILSLGGKIERKKNSDLLEKQEVDLSIDNENPVEPISKKRKSKKKKRESIEVSENEELSNYEENPVDFISEKKQNKKKKHKSNKRKSSSKESEKKKHKSSETETSDD